MIKKILIILFVIVWMFYPASYINAANTHSTDLEAGSSQNWSIAEGDRTGLDITGDMTVEMWMNVESAPGTYGFFTRDKDSGGGDEAVQMFYRDQAGKRINVDFRDSGGSETDGYASVDLGTATWHHVAVVFDVSVPDIDIWVDGVSKAVTMTLTNATSIIAADGDLDIGARIGVLYFDGKIDDVRIWDDKRTEAEIQANYQQELTGSEDNLQGYWKFNNDAGIGYTANSNDLTNENSATFSTDVPFAGAPEATPKPRRVIID